MNPVMEPKVIWHSHPSLPCFPTSLWVDVVVYHILSGFSVFKPNFIQFLLLRSAYSFAVNDLAPLDFANIIWFQHWFHGLTCGISEGYILRKTDDAALEFPIHHPGKFFKHRSIDARVKPARASQILHTLPPKKESIKTTIFYRSVAGFSNFDQFLPCLADLAINW